MSQHPFCVVLSFWKITFPFQLPYVNHPWAQSIVFLSPGYALQAVNIRNINDVFAETAEFAIGAATTAIYV